uniref:Zinc finger GRF-type domain-containing protein n=1 Tax=Brassica oleracea var. oleracea TaxID=109376 RepID=A0A0D3DWM2_BRAOL
MPKCQRTLGQDYSYTQPSSSDEFDMTSLLHAEADFYADEGESSYTIAETDQYSPEPEADEGILRTCYCGSEPIVATSYTPKDPGRRYFSCDNVDDGDCHIWKWWDVEIQESAQKDVERAFGVLQARFAIVKNPVRTLNKEKIGKIMRACIILHNMIVENERDGYMRYDISEFEEGDVTRSSQYLV